MADDRIWQGYSGVQDTTGVNYNTQQKTEGMGYISDKTWESTSSSGSNLRRASFGDIGAEGLQSGKKPKTYQPSMTVKRPPIEKQESFR
ncbi:MAG: hypothetical protein LBH75_01260 [Treponema sp.]|jgi:hypothetical protein|nr:hypothetical protein [Treponema sp.]